LGRENADKLSDFQKQSGATTGSFADAASFGDLLILGTKGTGAC
jgi:hypothetical protein